MMLLVYTGTHAQRVVIDRNHFATVNENGAVRLTNELAHNNYLVNIGQRLDDINVNISSVLLVQKMVHGSLTQVDNALKSGMAVMQVASISGEIIAEGNAMIDIARGNPALLLFAEGIARQLRDRGVLLAQEVSSFIIKEGTSALMDFEKRDALLRKVVLELKVMRALCYSMHRSIYWAKANGIFRTANPYRNYINMDLRKAAEISQGIKFLKY